MLRFSVPTKTTATSAFIQVSLLVIGVVIPADSLSAPAFEAQTAAENSLTGVHVTFASSKNGQSANPREVHCNITIDGEEIAMKLVQNDRLQIATPIYYLDENHTISTLHELDERFKDTKFYQEASGKAAVALTPRKAKETESETHDMDGLIFHRNSTYRISKMHANSKGMANVSGFDHRLKKLRRRGWTTDYIHTGGRRQQTMKAAATKSPQRRIRRELPAYEVDLLYVLDFSTYQSFKAEMSINNQAVTKAAVLQELRYYYAQVSNGVDMRYRGISTAPWTMRTKLVAFYIVTTAADSTWTEDIRAPGGQNGRYAVSAADSLERFTKWVYGGAGEVTISSMPKFNHAALFTSYDIFGRNSTDPNYGVIGLAYLEALCTPASSSIVENTGALTEADTSAHELGHSLGAQHDGVENNCSATDNNIMTAISTYASSTTAQNSYIFSNCSIDYFTKYIESLSSNCLTGTGNYFNTTEWEADMARLPGQVYSPNDLCRQAFGPSFEVCGGVDFGSSVCISISCYNTTGSGLDWSCQQISAGGRGPEGMSCGNKRWCQKGACVYNSSAPVASDTCPLGDFTRTAKVNPDEPYVCSNMPPSYCYDQKVFNTCCATCANLTDTSRPECPFGDKLNCSSISMASCPNNIDNCCKTCNEFSATMQTTTNTINSTSTIQPNSAISVTNERNSTVIEMPQVTTRMNDTTSSNLDVIGTENTKPQSTTNVVELVTLAVNESMHFNSVSSGTNLPSSTSTTPVKLSWNETTQPIYFTAITVQPPFSENISTQVKTATSENIQVSISVYGTTQLSKANNEMTLPTSTPTTQHILATAGMTPSNYLTNGTLQATMSVNTTTQTSSSNNGATLANLPVSTARQLNISGNETNQPNYTPTTQRNVVVTETRQPNAAKSPIPNLLLLPQSLVTWTVALMLVLPVFDC